MLGAVVPVRWRYGWRSGRRIDANRLVLEALSDGRVRTDPQLTRDTGLGLTRLYGALRRLRQLGMIEVLPRGRPWRLRRWVEYDDAVEGEIVYEVERT